MACSASYAIWAWASRLPHLRGRPPWLSDSDGSDRHSPSRHDDAWGRDLTIEGFDPREDVIDLRGVWGEGQQAQVFAAADGTRIALNCNQQSVVLPGVTVDQLLPGMLQIWQD